MLTRLNSPGFHRHSLNTRRCEENITSSWSSQHVAGSLFQRGRRDQEDDGIHSNGHHYIPMVQSYKARNDVEGIVAQLEKEVREDWEHMLALKGDDARNALDTLQSWLDENPEHVSRRRVLSLLVKIAAASNTLPSSVFVADVHLNSCFPINNGGFADIFHGTWNGQSVALKRLRVNDCREAGGDIQEVFSKEVLVWRQLRHPNIVPFIGVDGHTFKDISALAMISPWMENGNVMNYVRSDEYDARMDRQRLLIELAVGLEYLHAQHIVHGDVCDANVLITSEGHACLADFGLSMIRDISSSAELLSTGARVGSVRFIAPEVISETSEVAHKTAAGDVFAFGRLCYALCIRNLPFKGLSDMAILVRLLSDQRPARPSSAECGNYDVSDSLWDLLNQCWDMSPNNRPPTKTIPAFLRSMGNYKSLDSNAPCDSFPLPNDFRSGVLYQSSCRIPGDDIPRAGLVQPNGTLCNCHHAQLTCCRNEEDSIKPPCTHASHAIASHHMDAVPGSHPAQHLPPSVGRNTAFTSVSGVSYAGHGGFDPSLFIPVVVPSSEVELLDRSVSISADSSLHNQPSAESTALTVQTFICEIDACGHTLPIDKALLATHLKSHGYGDVKRGRAVECRWASCACARQNQCKGRHAGHCWHGENVLEHIWDVHLAFQDPCPQCGDVRWQHQFSKERHVKTCPGRKPARCRGCATLFGSYVALAEHLELGQCVGS